MNRWKEIAKFASGAEAFHAFVHTVLGLSGTTLTVFGISATPPWHFAGVIVHAAIALALGVYAWGYPATVPSGVREMRAPAA